MLQRALSFLLLVVTHKGANRINVEVTLQVNTVWSLLTIQKWHWVSLKPINSSPVNTVKPSDISSIKLVHVLSVIVALCTLLLMGICT